MDPSIALPDSLAEGELRLLERLSGLINSLDEPQTVLERMMDLFLSAMGAERGLLLQFGAAGAAKPVVVRNFSQDAVDGVAHSFSRRAVDAMTEAGTVVVSQDAGHDQRFRDSVSIEANRIHSLLCVPIRTGSVLYGALYVDSRDPGRSFSN